MKFRSVLLAVSCWLSAVNGQWFEKSIGLPDSLGGLHPRAAYYVPSSNCIYVTGEEGVMVVDAATNVRVARLDLNHPMFLAFDSRDNKVYMGSSESDLLSVIDPVAHRVVSTLSVGRYPYRVCYNPTANKVYCLTGSDLDTVTVVDCSSDSVLASIWVGWNEFPFSGVCCNPVGNKVYVSSFETGSVAVIDGAGDSLLRTLPVGDFPVAPTYSPVSNKLYCVVTESSEVAVFDAGPDTLLRLIGVASWPIALGYNPVSNKVYSGDGDGNIQVIDCYADTSLALLGPASGEPREFLYDSVDNRVFCFSDYYASIPAISGSGDTIDGWVEFSSDGEDPDPACYSPQQNRLYIRGRGTDDVTVVDAATCAVTGSVQMNSAPYLVCYSPLHDKLYCLDYESGSIWVIDCSANHLSRTLQTPVTELRMPVYSSGSDKLYCVGRQGSDYVLVVVDCALDSVIATLQMNHGTYALTYNPANDRVYWANYDDLASTVTVVDCRRDSIVAEVPVGTYLGGLTCNPDSNRVYCASSPDDTLLISAIDGSGDTVTSTVDTHCGASVNSFSMCYVPSRDVVCTTTGGREVVVVDGAARQVLGPLPLGGHPSRLLFNPLSNKLYCLLPDSDNLAVIDCEYMSPEGSIRLADGPSDIGLDSIANRVYVTHRGFGCVSIVDGRTSRFLGLVEAGVSPGSVAWAPQHRRMYIADEEGHAVIVLADSALTGIAGEPTSSSTRALATVVRGALLMAGSRQNTGYRAELLDIGGRRVLDLMPGANDVRALAPGVYFVRQAQAQAQAQAVRKVIITR